MRVRAPGVVTRSRALVLAFGVLLAAVAPLRAAVHPPHIAYTLRVLPNGLRVILSEDHSTPIVHVSVTYHVGSKNERAGRTGFAHLFEHMMFKGSKNVAPEAHTSMIASVGGRSNAYTTEDETVFWQTLPSQHLPLALWLEADRMATLRLDEDVFLRERAVVEEERRMRVENQPYGRLLETLYAQAFTRHPYRHPTIGSMTDLAAASIQDVRDFHATYYQPGNAVLTIVGDIDTAQAMQLVTRDFGRVPKGRAAPREIPAEPAQTRERRAAVEGDGPLPAVVVAYHVPADGNPDVYPLQLAAKVLSDGESARIPHDVVHEKRLALTAFATANITEDPNLFYAVAILEPGVTAQAAEQALVDEFDRLRTAPITDEEWHRARNQWVRDDILMRETVQDRARLLSHAVDIRGDTTTVDGELEAVMRTTAADVQRAARTYFTEQNRDVIYIMPKNGGSR